MKLERARKPTCHYYSSCMSNQQIIKAQNHKIKKGNFSGLAAFKKVEYGVRSICLRGWPLS